MYACAAADAGRVLDVRSLDARFDVIDGAIRVLAVVEAHLCACCEVLRCVFAAADLQKWRFLAC